MGEKSSNKEFLFLSGPKDNTDAIEREHAFRDALKKHQIPFDEDHYAEGDFGIQGECGVS